MNSGSCPNRAESSPLNTTTRSLVLQNYFPDNPNATKVCADNSAPLASMLETCYEAAGKRWPNFIAVDYYQVCTLDILVQLYLQQLYLICLLKNRRNPKQDMKKKKKGGKMCLVYLVICCREAMVEEPRKLLIKQTVI